MINTKFSLLISLLILLFILQATEAVAQEFERPTVKVNGEVAKIFETIYEVSERETAFTFKKFEFIRGAISKISP